MSDTAQVEVVATVKESAASYRETGQMNLEVLDLRKLDARCEVARGADG